MMIKNTITSVFLLFASLLLTGCWESSDVKFHEPGKYLGAADSLKTDPAALQKRLENQQDR
jgi:outer membrane biogenesis lipoprotein LolB